MTSRVELLNSGKLRLDGRRPLELRSLALELGVPSSSSTTLAPSSSSHLPPDGFARVSQGLTTVQASIYGPREPRKASNALHDRATIDVELSLEPWSGRERRKRNRADRRLTEMASAIKSTFEPVVHTHLYPRSEIDVCVVVEHQDGGVLSCAINAVTLALLDAGVPMTDFVLSLTAGLHLNPPSVLLDLSTTEESDLPNLVLAILPGSGEVTLLQSETRMHYKAFDELIQLAKEGCTVLHREMERAARERVRRLAVESRGGRIGEGEEGKGMIDEEDEGMMVDPTLA